MKWINFGRCCGKSALMISSAYVNEIPIIVRNLRYKENLLKQAKDMNCDGIQVFTLDDWLIKNNKGYPKPDGDNKVLIDEAQEIIESALRYYLNANVVAATMTIPMVEKESPNGQS